MATSRSLPKMSLVPDYDDSDSNASDSESRAADLPETNSTCGVRSRCDFEHSTLDDRLEDDISENARVSGVDDGDDRSSRSSLSSRTMRENLNESAPKRRRNDVQEHVISTEEDFGKSFSGLNVAGEESTKRVLGSRFAAHALFQRSVVKQSPDEPQDSTVSIEEAASDVQAPEAVHTAASAGAEIPSQATAQNPEYAAWWAANMAMWQQQMAAAYMAQQHGGVPLPSSSAAAFGHMPIDSTAADKMRLEKVSRRELGIDLVGKDSSDPLFTAALLSSAGGPGRPEMVEVKGSDIMPRFNPAENLTSQGAAALRAARATAFHGSLWDGDRAEFAESRGGSARGGGRRKHQINYLAMDAQAKALQVADRNAAGAKARALAHQKYGW